MLESPTRGEASCSEDGNGAGPDGRHSLARSIKGHASWGGAVLRCHPHDGPSAAADERLSELLDTRSPQGGT
jgi:hypothetical protein